MEQLDINKIKNILKVFVVKIKSFDILGLVYKYYISDYNQINNKCNEMSYDFLIKQLNRKILSEKNDYWELKLSDIKLVEDNLNILNTKDIKSYIDYLFNSMNISEELRKIDIQDKNVEEKKSNKIKDILSPRDNILLKPVEKIINNNREWPYKSDKIKSLLNLTLSIDQIFNILFDYESLRAQRSYIEKYDKERKENIDNGKIKIYPLEDRIKEVLVK